MSNNDNQFNEIKKIFENALSLLKIPKLSLIAANQIKNAIVELNELDALLNEISQVNRSLSKAHLEKIGNDAFDAASSYGIKAADYLANVKEMARAGYAEPEEIAKLSVAAQEAGGITADLANQFIAAANEAYHMNDSVKELLNVLDGVNYISSRNALNMADLAQGMSIVSSQAAALGINADETAAMLAVMISSTKQSGTEMGQALNDVLLNMQQITTTDIGAEGISEYEKACNALNVSLKETKNGIVSLRDPMDVIKELAGEYNKLDSNDVRKTNLLNTVGGGPQAEALNAILENYDLYSKMLEEYSQGSGSLFADAQDRSNSLDASLNKLNNTITDIANNVVNSGLMTDAVNMLNTILGCVNGLTEAIGPLGTLGAIIGATLGAKNVGSPKTSGLYHCFEYADCNKSFLWIHKFSYCLI